MKQNTHCIFRRGQSYAENSAHTAPDGTIFAGYTDGETAADYIARKNSALPPDAVPFEILPWDEALPILREASRLQYVTEWQEIDEETWFERLEILPPENWKTVQGVEIFRISEYLTANITQHLARLGKRFFSRNCETFTPYAELAAQVSTL